MRQAFTAPLLAGIIAGFLATGAARAADGVWIQIEARPDLASAQSRARDWQAAFPEVAGFQLSSGWFGLALGPHDAQEAAARLAQLKAEGRIPADSYIVRGRYLGDQFWAGVGQPQPVAATAIPQTETPAEARRAEDALDAATRQQVQQALRWAGVYDGGIDGAFGPGTRNAMTLWQQQQGLEATGVLTSSQRADLMEGYRRDIAALGLKVVRDGPAGIEIALPLGLVGDVAYAPPFANYPASDGSDVSIALISSPDPEDFGIIANRLLDEMPEAQINRTDGRLILQGSGSYARIELAGDLIKGYRIDWPPARDRMMARVAEEMAATYRPLPERALDPSYVPGTTPEGVALARGLEVRRPDGARSGVHIGPGQVLTTAEAVEGCRALQVDQRPAKIQRLDQARGLAYLSTPVENSAPGEETGEATSRADAQSPALRGDIQRDTLQQNIQKPALREDMQNPALRAEAHTGAVTIAGYSTGPSMPAPAISTGRLAAKQPDGTAQLSARILPGDWGGPVLDATGAVVGLVLARERGQEQRAALISATGGAAQPIPPAEMQRVAREITARVFCWR